MSIVNIEGFKVYSNLNGTKSIIIRSDRIDDCMRVYREKSLDGVAITIDHGYELSNVDFLTRYPFIKRLSISNGISDINGIYSLESLESLIISGKRKIDFSPFSLLKELRAEWSPHFLNLRMCRNLKVLALSNFSPSSRDCTAISDLGWVNKLQITQSTIKNLRGLENFYQLDELQIDYGTKLENICSLENSKETLVSLLFDHCKAIQNHQYVIKLKQLGTLAFNHCGTMTSIEFIKKIPKLKSFRFVGTDVADGNIAPCLGLDYASFSDKRHFSHTVKQIRDINNN